MKNVTLSTSMYACGQLKKEMHDEASPVVNHFMSERFSNKFTSLVISYFSVRPFHASFSTINSLNIYNVYEFSVRNT